MKTNSRGFTTIELAVVAAIVGILAAVCPSFNAEMAQGLFLVGASPLIAKLLRGLKVPMIACVVAALATALIGLRDIGSGAETAPSFRTLVKVTREGAAKASLAKLRTALEAYREEKGAYPENLNAIPAIPAITVPPATTPSAAIRHGRVSDGAGGWLYDNAKGSPSFGKVWINATHTDSKGAFWTAY